jgi:outer membrane protein
MRKAFILIIFIAAVASSQAQAVGFKTVSLKQAIEYGVQNNISAKNAKLSETEAKAKNHELLSIGLPQINANFDYSYYMIRPTSPAFAKSLSVFGLPASTKLYFQLPHNISTGANLSQLIYDTRFFIGIQTFKELIKVSKLTTALTEQEIKYSIIKSYSETQAAKEILRTLDSNLVIVQKLLHDTRETYKAGLIEELDVNRLELGEATLKSQINNTHNMYELSLSALKYMMGLQLTDKIALTDDVETLRKQMGIISNSTLDPSQRLESELLQSSIMLRDYDRKQRKAGYYPALYGFANFGGGSQVTTFKEFFEKQHFNDGTTSSNWFMQSYVGFTIKVPIYDGGQKEASVKQAKIELEKAKNDLENFRNQSSLQVEAAKTTFTTNLAEEENAKQTMMLNNKIFNKTQLKFKEGIGSSFELMQTQQDQSMNQIKYYTAVKNVLTSKAELDKALGIK